VIVSREFDSILVEVCLRELNKFNVNFCNMTRNKLFFQYKLRYFNLRFQINKSLCINYL